VLGKSENLRSVDGVAGRVPSVRLGSWYVLASSGGQEVDYAVCVRTGVHLDNSCGLASFADLAGLVWYDAVNVRKGVHSDS
jgi:hypothetical protein